VTRAWLGSLLAAGAIAAAGSGCYRDPAAPGPWVDSTSVTTASLTARDPSRTYEYAFSQVRPDSVLLALHEDEIPLVAAWLPLDYMCDDAIGPRLTVELSEPDTKMFQHDFVLGTGRLECSTNLRQYVVVP
jgi:hypothetical protein